MLRGEAAGRVDRLPVVRRDRGRAALGEQHRYQVQERRVDVRPVLVGDLGRLLVRALAEAHAGAQRHDPPQVGLRAVEAGLQHDADVAQALVPDGLEDPERGLDGRRALHVDADEPVPRGGRGQNPAQVVRAQRAVELQADLRELHRDLAGQAGGAHPLDDLQVVPRRTVRHLRRGHVLAQVVQRMGEPPAVEILDDAHGLVEGLAADEAPGEAAPAPHAVARGAGLEQGAAGECQEEGPRQRVPHRASTAQCVSAEPPRSCSRWRMLRV